MIRASLLLALSLPLSAKEIDWLKDDVVQQARNAVVVIQVDPDTGITGFFVSDDGLIVTSAAGLEGRSSVVIRGSGGEEYKNSQVMAIDAANDLAVLATGRKPPAYLGVHEQPAGTGAACAVIYHSPLLIFKIIDGQLMSRRLSLDGTESRFLDIWSVALSPAASGLTGAPVITSDGKVAGMCDLITGNARQRYVMAIPEAPIISVVQRARRAKRPLPFPAFGEISVSGVPQGEAYRSGMKQIATGDLLAALESFRTALMDNPDNPLVMTQEAFCQVSLGNHAEARKLLERVRVLAPKRLRARTILGHVLEAMGEHEQAETCFRELTIDAPQLEDGWLGLGLRQLNAGNAVAAVIALKKCTELVPESMENWNRYAQALAETGKYSESYAAMEKVSELESLFFAVRYSAPKRP